MGRPFFFPAIPIYGVLPYSMIMLIAHATSKQVITGPSEVGRQGRPGLPTFVPIFSPVQPLNFELAYFCPSQRHGSSKLAVRSMSACIERDSTSYMMSVHDLQCSEKLLEQFLGS